jgi:chromosome partitioning protein
VRQRVLALISQKGGVGKTTLALHLAFHAAERSSVLVVDMDTQGNATSTLLGDAALPYLHTRGGAADLFEKPLADVAPIATRNPRIHLLWGHQHLDDVKPQLADVVRLRPALAGLPYDVVIFDTPPALGPRQIAPLLLAHRAVLPFEPNAYAVQGLALTLPTIEQVRRSNPGLDFSVVINKYQRAAKSQAAHILALARAAGAVGPRILEPHLTLRVAVQAALDTGVPVWAFRSADRRLRADWQSLAAALLEIA